MAVSTTVLVASCHHLPCCVAAVEVGDHCRQVVVHRKPWLVVHAHSLYN